jgi:hypothetical protein
MAAAENAKQTHKHTCTAAVVVLKALIKLSRLPHLALMASSNTPLQGAASCTDSKGKHRIHTVSHSQNHMTAGAMGD